MNEHISHRDRGTDAVDMPTIEFPAVAPPPAEPVTYQALRSLVERFPPAPMRPCAYRVNPATVAALPRHEQQFPWQSPTVDALLGFPVIHDQTVPVGMYQPVWPRGGSGGGRSDWTDAGGKTDGGSRLGPQEPLQPDDDTADAEPGDQPGPVILAVLVVMLLLVSLLVVAVCVAIGALGLIQ